MASHRGKITLMTGGGSGIGRAVAEELARRGATVILADVDGELARDAAREIQDAGGAAEAVLLDVADATAFEACVEDIHQRHGRLDYLVNNAGIGITGEVRDMTAEDWDHILGVNLHGVIHGIRAAYPKMIEQGNGHILNIACVAGLVPFPMAAAYCATKHAVVALSAALRAEAATHGVKVSVACPGTVDTSMFENIRYLGVDKSSLVAGISPALISPQRCARAVVKGIERNRSLIPISAHAHLTWWLYRFAPRPFLALTERFFRAASKRLVSPHP